MGNHDWKRLHGGFWAHANLLAHHGMLNLHWSKPSSNVSFPMKTFRFLQVGIHLFLYCVSLYFLQNHSLGPVLEFLNYLLLRPPAQLVRETGTKSDILCPQLLAWCLACVKIINVAELVWGNCFFLSFKNSLFCVNSLLLQTFSVITLSQLLLSWS